MQYRFLGNSGLKVSVLSLGGWVTYGKQVEGDVTSDCMKAAWDAGINFFDTAEVYAAGKCEEAMGAVLKKYGWKRSDLVISTKIFWGGEGPNDVGLSRKHIIEGLTASLQRLQLDYVDIVFAHRPDVTTPMEETVRAFNYCLDKGLAFYWGTSEWSAQQIEEARRVATRLNLVGPLCEQPQYNCFHRERFEKEYAELYKSDYGLGTTIWSPLASGLLTGKYNDAIPEGSRLSLDDNIMKQLRGNLDTEEGKQQIVKVRKLTKVAERLGCTTAQLSLAWCVKNPNVSSVITGASRASQVQENIKCLDVVPKLTDEVMKEIEDILVNKPAMARQFRS